MNKPNYTRIVIAPLILLLLFIVIVISQDDIDSIVDKKDYDAIQVFVILKKYVLNSDHYLEEKNYLVVKAEDYWSSSKEIVNVLQRKGVLSKESYDKCKKISDFKNKSLRNELIDRAFYATSSAIGILAGNVALSDTLYSDYLPSQIYVTPKRKWYNSFLYYYLDYNLHEYNNAENDINICKITYQNVISKNKLTIK